MRPAPPDDPEAFEALINAAAPPRLIHPAQQYEDTCGWLARGGDGALTTGYTELDALTGGMRPREMTVIAARPAVGKTLAGLCIATHIADTLDQPVLYTSLEMARLQLELRRMSALADVPLRRLVRAIPEPEDWAKINEVSDQLRRTPLRIDDDSPQGLPQIREALAEMEADGAPAALHVLDYLGLAAMPRAESRQQAVADFARAYRQMAKDLNIPVVALVQLNRNLEVRKSRRPLLSDLRESGELEQVADVVILLHRDDPSAATGDIEWIVAKNRQGAPGVVTLRFEGSRARITERGALWVPTAFGAADYRVDDLPARRRDEA
jgi:replicative DNA helicase